METSEFFVELLDSKVFLLVFDKVLLLIVLFFVGYGVTKTIEKYKLEQALTQELMKERLTIINEIWRQLTEDKIFIFNELSASAESAFTDGELDRDKWETNVTKFATKCSERTKLFQNLIERNRYWLGDSAFFELIGYYNEMISFIDNMHSLTPAEIEEKGNIIANRFPSYQKLVQAQLGIKIGSSENIGLR